MTRMLSNLLSASEPQFRLRVRELEKASGHRNADIRLSVQVMHAAKDTLRQLGLDPADTTGKELYQALIQRVSADDIRLERLLRTRAATQVSAEAKLSDGIDLVLRDYAAGSSVLALKMPVMKRLLKAMPPKRLQKQLGYRSLDALLRREPPALIVMAARNVESVAWRRDWNDAYKKLTAHDFEARPIQVISVGDSRWSPVAQKLIEDQSYTLLTMPEAAALAVLPLPTDRPNGMVIATVALALQACNNARISGSYLQATQVKNDFGQHVQKAADGTLSVPSAHIGIALPWQIIQQHMSATKTTINEDAFGPYAQTTDFIWHEVEAVLSELLPSLHFWEHSATIASVHDGHVVSCNLLDAALAACNQLSFEARSLLHMQRALWDELLLQHVDHQSLEQTVSAYLRPQLAFETATN